MEKYNNIQSSNEYITYTIKNYLSCYEDMDIDEIKRMTGVFDSLKDHTLSLGNVLVDNAAQYGVMLDLTPDKKVIRSTQDVTKQLDGIKGNIDTVNNKELIFFQSVAHLIDSLQYADGTELLNLNDVFQGISKHKHVLGVPLGDERTNFYPYDRSKSYSDNKKSPK